MKSEQRNSETSPCSAPITKPQIASQHYLCTIIVVKTRVIKNWTSHAWEHKGSSKILVLPQQLCHHNAYKGIEELQVDPCDQQVPAKIFLVAIQNQEDTEGNP
jgi:hypothetical protein